MANFKENKIESFAFDFLQNHYATLPATREVLIAQNQRTKKGHTADGIVASLTHDHDLFMASLSVSQSAKMAKLLVKFKDSGLSRYRYGTAVGALALAFWLGSNTAGAGILTCALALVAAIAVFLGHSLLEWELMKRQVKSMVDTLSKQPADQKWLGLSISSLSFRNNELAAYLLQLCSNRGIGILTVGKRAKVVVMQEAKTIKCRRGDFLSHYEAEDQIRASLANAKHLKVA